MTHTDIDTLDLQDAIQKLMSDRFREVRIVKVSIEDGFFCDDGVIEITVEFEGTTEALVRGQPSGLFGMVRDRVADFCSKGVPNPVFNFLSSDARA